MASIRWGILGCGDVCEVKSGPAFQRVEGSELVAVMRRDAARAEDFARRHGVPKWTTDVDELIDSCDAVYVATPPGSHEELALRVAAAGKPCYVEKPMARNAAECRRMIDAFAARKLPLFVAYYRRALPRFLLAREKVRELGPIRKVVYRFEAPPGALSAEMPWRLSAEQSGGGIFMDLACHALDMIDFLCGPLTGVQGRAENRAGRYDVEDTVAVSWEGGWAEWYFNGSGRHDELYLGNERGDVRLSIFGNEPILVDGPTPGSFPAENPRHIQQPLIQTIVDQLNGRGVCPSTGESALRTQIVMDTALESYYGTRADGFWKDPASWPGRRAAGR